MFGLCPSRFEAARDGRVMSGLIAARTPTPFDAWAWQRVTRDRYPVALLSLAWIVAFVLVDPRGNFALNDDWAYALMVERFLSTGSIQPTSWTFTPSISHIGVGAAFAEAFGFSHAVLRCSNLFMGWAGMLGVYVLGRVLGRAPLVAALAAACFGFNPVHLSLAATYMTDLPFSTWFTWALVGGVLGFRGRRWGFALALSCTALALSSRQPALALLLALVCTALVGYAGTSKRICLVAAAMLGVGTVAIWGFDSFLAAKNARVFPMFLSVIREPSSLSELLMESVAVWNYVGLGVLALVPLLPALSRRGDRRVFWWGILLTGLALAGVLRLELHPPLGTAFNIFNAHGLGATAMHGLILRQELPASLCWGIAVLAIAAASWVVLQFGVDAVASGWSALRSDRATFFFIVSIASYVVPIVVRGGFFDRYFLPVLPAVIFLALGSVVDVPSRLKMSMVGVALLLQATFGVLGTRDHIDHHRVRTALIQIAEKDLGAPPEQIEGGFEFDGYRNYDRVPAEMAESKGRDARRSALAARIDVSRDPSVWPMGDRFVVSLSPRIDGYRVVRRASYFRTLIWQEEAQYLHERIVRVGGTSADAARPFWSSTPPRSASGTRSSRRRGPSERRPRR